MTEHHGAVAEALDLDADVLHAYWADVMTAVRAAATGPCHRVLDLGAGTGNGALALAQRFDDAEVIAVDADEDMLERLRAKAVLGGVADRVRTIRFDLDTGWPDLGDVDVTWASSSLHHVADPDRVLRDVFAATRPGGVVAVAEFDAPLRFLSDDVGDGMEQRCLDAIRAVLAHDLPHLGSDWPHRLRAAGFSVETEQAFPIALDPPHSPEAARYARLSLAELRHRLADSLTPADAEALAAVLDGDDSALRNDLRIRGSRALTIARRP